MPQTPHLLNVRLADEIHHLPGGRLQIIIGNREYILGRDLLEAIRNTPREVA